MPTEKALTLLEERFYSYMSAQGKRFYKQLPFALIYEDLLAQHRGKPVVVVELGVGKGGSLQVWKEYFGHTAKIWGIDCEDKLAYDDPDIEFLIGDQADADFLRSVHEKIPKIDIFIDDGSHVSYDQLLTYEILFPIISPGGYYFIEDVQTSYRPKIYGGGYKAPGACIEYFKELIDGMHNTEDERIKVDNNMHSTESIMFHRALISMRKLGTFDPK